MKYNLIIILRSIAIIYLFTTSFFSISQNISTSPYSSFGIGSTEDVEHGIFSGIGNATITYTDSTVLNYFNPASYHTLSKGQPILSTSLSSRISLFTENGIHANAANVVLSHFALGFSFANRLGAAFGFKPYSRRGYDFTAINNVGTDTISNTYKGTGSTNEAFVGLSARVLSYKNFDLAVGGNVGYVFGTVSNKRYSQLNDLISGGVEYKDLQIGSFHYQLALSLNQKINDHHSITLNGVYDPSQAFKAKRNTDLFYATDVLDQSKYYRLDSTGKISGIINMPSIITTGFNYRIAFKDVAKNATVRNSELSFHTTLKLSRWADYKETFDGVEELFNYYNTYNLSIGLQYTPETSFLNTVSKGMKFDQIRYRAGFYNYTLPIQQSLNTITDYGVTLGFGIPIKVQKSMSSINIGVAYGKRSNGVSTDFTENYTSINFSLIMAPGNFEKWFVKRKYD